jgi:peroxiredoxin Q/BCP
MKAPDFSLQDQHGNVRTLEEFGGKWLVVYFYPKDDTPGCTNEACSFRDGREALESLGAEVVGISKDTVKSHAKFAAKHGLAFTLLADPEHTTIEAFGSWVPKKFMGREYLGINRDTYLINPGGEIVKKYEGVDPKTHFDEIVKDLRNLQ